MGGLAMGVAEQLARGEAQPDRDLAALVGRDELVGGGVRG